MNKIKLFFKTPQYHLYLLQLENYELGRYWRLLIKKGYFAVADIWRKKIDWTPKLFIIAALAALVPLISAYFFVYFFPIFNNPNIWPVAGFLFGFFLYALFLSAAVVILSPFDWLMKKIIVGRAQRKLKHFPALEIVGLAGSYGKTTAKEVILAMVGEDRRVLATPENINTPLGIARLILEKLNSDIQVLLVEMGEYYRGDIKKICRLAPPDIALITGINEAHLERFKNIKNTVATIFEIAEYARPKATVILNADDKLVKENYKKFAENKNIKWYSSHNDALSDYKAVEVDFHEDGGGFDCEFRRQGRYLCRQKVALLGDYAKGDVVAGLEAGRALGISEQNLFANIKNIRPIAHRLQPIFNKEQNILIIDDSYNGNPAGALAAVMVLGKFKSRRKVYITPGLVEMGAEAERVHRALGQALARVAAVVILIKNSVTPFIAAGLVANGFSESNIIWYDTALKAHVDLKRVLQPNDAVLFQNDWGDNYV